MLQDNCWWQPALNPAAKVSSPSSLLIYERATRVPFLLCMPTAALLRLLPCAAPSLHARSGLLTHFLWKPPPLADVQCSNFFQDLSPSTARAWFPRPTNGTNAHSSCQKHRETAPTSQTTGRELLAASEELVTYTVNRGHKI